MQILQKIEQIDTLRDDVIARALTARTEAEIKSAREAVTNWLEMHPDDTSISDLFEVLALRDGVA